MARPADVEEWIALSGSGLASDTGDSELLPRGVIVPAAATDQILMPASPNNQPFVDHEELPRRLSAGTSRLNNRDADPTDRIKKKKAGA